MFLHHWKFIILFWSCHGGVEELLLVCRFVPDLFLMLFRTFVCWQRFFGFLPSERPFPKCVCVCVVLLVAYIWVALGSLLGMVSVAGRCWRQGLFFQRLSPWGGPERHIEIVFLRCVGSLWFYCFKSFLMGQELPGAPQGPYGDILTSFYPI